MKHPIVIAIDGTSASGKSTNAKLVAKALGYVYVDTDKDYQAWLDEQVTFAELSAPTKFGMADPAGP